MNMELLNDALGRMLYCMERANKQGSFESAWRNRVGLYAQGPTERMRKNKVKIARNNTMNQFEDLEKIEPPYNSMEMYRMGNVIIQRMNFNAHWYAICNNWIVDHSQYRHDLFEAIKRSDYYIPDGEVK